jgi:hypothetical protein
MILTAGDNARAGRETTPLFGLPCRLAHSASDPRFEYPDSDDFDEDAPTYGSNPATGGK